MLKNLFSNGGWVGLKPGTVPPANIVQPGCLAFKVPASLTEPPFIAIVEHDQVLAINPAADSTWGWAEVAATPEQRKRVQALLGFTVTHTAQEGGAK